MRDFFLISLYLYQLIHNTVSTVMSYWVQRLTAFSSLSSYFGLSFHNWKSAHQLVAGPDTLLCYEWVPHSLCGIDTP